MCTLLRRTTNLHSYRHSRQPSRVSVVSLALLMSWKKRNFTSPSNSSIWTLQRNWDTSFSRYSFMLHFISWKKTMFECIRDLGPWGKLRSPEFLLRASLLRFSRAYARSEMALQKMALLLYFAVGFGPTLDYIFHHIADTHVVHRTLILSRSQSTPFEVFYIRSWRYLKLVRRRLKRVCIDLYTLRRT